MIITLTETDINLNLGTLDIMRSMVKFDNPQVRKLSYEEGSQKKVKVYKDGSTLFIEAEELDLNFKLYIDNPDYSNIKVKIGGIKSTALASIQEAYTIKIGAIQLMIRQEEVGDLYMCVNNGLIIASNLITVTPYNNHGCKAHYRGKLHGQKTEVFVDAGAILCTILQHMQPLNLNYC